MRVRPTVRRATTASFGRLQAGGVVYDRLAGWLADVAIRVGLRSELAVEGVSARLARLLLRVDRDPRVALLGGLLGLAVFLAQLANRHPVIEAFADGLVVLSLVAPVAGLTGIVAVFALRPPELLGVIGFVPTVAFAALFGCLVRLFLERPTLKVRFATLAIVLFGAACVYDYLRVGGNVPLGHEVAATSQLVDVGAGLALLLAAIYLGTRMGRSVIFATVLVAASALGVIGLITWVPDLLTNLGRSTYLMTTDYAGRAFGPFSHATYFGVCAALAFVFIVAWPAGPESRWWRIARLVAGFCAGAAVVMSMTRGATLACEVGLVILAFQRGRRAGLVGLVLAVLFLLVVFPRFVDWRLSLTFGSNLAKAHEVLDESSGWRIDTMVAGVRLFLQDPIFGAGFGQFHFLSPRYLGSDVGISYSHNSYINVLAEQGLLGFGSFMMMLLGIGWTLLRSPSGVAAMLAVYAVFLFSGLTTELVSSIQTTGSFWILLGLALATALTAWPENPRPAEAAIPPSASAVAASDT